MQKNKKRKTVEYGRYGVYFIIPFFLVFAIWQLWPLIYTIGLGFCENYTDSMFNTEVGPNFIGFENIKNALVSKDGVLFDTYTCESIATTIITIINIICTSVTSFAGFIHFA